MPTMVFGLVVIACLMVSSEAAALDQPSLRTFAEYAIREDRVAFDPPKLDWSGPRVSVHWGGLIRTVPNDEDDLLRVPVLAQFQLSGLRRYRSSAEQRAFWEPVLTRAEVHVSRMIELAEKGGDNAKQSIDDEHFAMLEEIRNELEVLAKDMGKLGVVSQKPFSTWRVRFQIPDGCTMEIMDAGDWELYWFRRQRGEEVIAPKWQPIRDPWGWNLLGGAYYLRVTFPNGLKERVRYNIKSTDANSTIIWSLLSKI